ncbi:hypothetical protein CPHO_09900 [Corynebacterium phocae]|uniref:HTH cro/C1-type domain-containing protein n=1 Tax=Corynebacterium phocae TaxID=161895 RepID=A0A1L7D4S9_9CORY|nr:helix-turn-helix domain-containing protein [Corynebacterium phocae]APT93149.1 hypothetical protein CPHO_09900 [Corynebacterium phocae]KAA8722227.1 helix-turn-helix transcriptional regulator [Corynebacterium phocae]
METNEIGHFAKQQRKQLGLPQQDLADLAEVSDRFVREFKTGRPTVHLDKAVMVLSVLGYDLVPALPNTGGF